MPRGLLCENSADMWIIIWAKKMLFSSRICPNILHHLVVVYVQHWNTKSNEGQTFGNLTVCVQRTPDFPFAVASTEAQQKTTNPTAQVLPPGKKWCNYIF
jgi:hypothetical protein